MSKQPKTILVFTAGDYTTASSKYRAFLLGRYLTGVRPDIVWKIVEPSTKDISSMPVARQIYQSFRQVRELFWLPRHDVVFMQRSFYNKFIFFALVAQNVLHIRPSIFDLDDATFIHSPLKTRWLTKTATAVVVGSRCLYEYARRYNKDVVLIPTCIKFSDYAAIQRGGEHTKEVTLGWIGNGPSYIPELTFVAEVLRTLSARNIPYRFLLIGTYGSPAIHKLFDFIPEDRKSVIKYVDAKSDMDLVPYFTKMDIGLMPLQDTLWNRGKCAFKAVQYMAAGSAVVASPVGENAFLITHRTTGLLATTAEEWTVCLEELIKNPALRNELGLSARAHVQKNYSFESQCAVVGSVIDSATGEARTGVSG